MGQFVSNTLRENLVPGVRTTQKVLRVGTIENGRLTDERIFRRRDAVTVGASHRNSFIVMESGLPARFPLFELRQGQYVLHVTQEMTGKVSVNGSVVDLSVLHTKEHQVGMVSLESAAGERQEKTNVYEVPLQENARGKLQLGSITLLFQFITPPALPKPLLASDWRPSSLFSGVDWVYASIILVSFSAHSGLVLALQNIGTMEKVEHVSERFDPNRFIRLPPGTIRDVMRPQKDKEKDKTASKDKTKTTTKTRKRPRGRTTRDNKPAKLTRKQIASRLQNVGILRILGTEGQGKGSPVANLFRGGEDALTRGLDGVESVRVSSVQRRRGPRCTNGCKREKLSLKDRLVGPTAPSHVAFSQKRRQIRLQKRLKQLQIEKIEEPVGVGDAGKLMRSIRKKRWQIIFCYEKALKENAQLRGKFAIRISINQSGRVFETEVEEDQVRSQKMARCIIKRFKRWRFPRPKGRSISVSIPFVFAPNGG